MSAGISPESRFDCNTVTSSWRMCSVETNDCKNERFCETWERFCSLDCETFTFIASASCIIDTAWSCIVLILSSILYTGSPEI